MADKKHLIIYDRSSNDSLICAAIMKYYLCNDDANSVDASNIIATNYDELPFTEETPISNISKTYESITICGAVILNQCLNNSYKALGSGLLVIESDPVYMDIIKSLIPAQSVLYKKRLVKSELAEGNILNIGQSVSKTLFNYLYKDKELPLFLEYIDGFITDSYYEYGISRDEVIYFDKGFSVRLGNDFTIVYNFILNNLNNPDCDIDGFIDEGEERMSVIDEIITTNFEKYGSQEFSIAGYRKGILILTDEKLTQEVILNPLFSEYDNIVTLYRLKSGMWKMGLYTILHDVSDIDPDNITYDDRVLLYSNSFCAGMYMMDKYNGYGNDIFGYATLSNPAMTTIFRTAEFSR